MNYYSTPPRSDELWHYGIKGMRWGVRRYENEDGSLTPAGKKRYTDDKNKEYRKKLRKERAKKVGKALALTTAAAATLYGGKKLYDNVRIPKSNKLKLKELAIRRKQKPLENTNRVLNNHDSEQRRNNLIRWVTKLDNAYYDKKQKIDDNYYKNKSMSSYDYNKALSQLMKKYDRISKNIYSKYRSTYNGFKA